MSFSFALSAKSLIDRINKKDVIAMIVCARCVLRQKKCRMSSLFKRCDECIRFNKKCEPSQFVVNFDSIDRVMKKLKRKKLKIKIAWKLANEIARVKQVKLECLRVQKRLLKKKKQTMFDKKLLNVKKLQRLENLNKVANVKRSIFFATFLIDWFDDENFNVESMRWLDDFFDLLKIVAKVFDNS